MARLVQIVIDSSHPASLAKFWAAMLDEFEIRPYDGAEIARLGRLGQTPETDPCVILDGAGLEICFQQTDCVPSAPRRPLHLDVASTDRAAEVVRAASLGATTVASFDDHSWMRDPEGNDFCIVDARPNDVGGF